MAKGSDAKKDVGKPRGAEHTKNARKSTKEQHQSGKTRKFQDRGGEKGDATRSYPRNRPDNWKGPWPPYSFITMNHKVVVQVASHWAGAKSLVQRIQLWAEDSRVVQSCKVEQGTEENWCYWNLHLDVTDVERFYGLFQPLYYLCTRRMADFGRRTSPAQRPESSLVVVAEREAGWQEFDELFNFATRQR